MIWLHIHTLSPASLGGVSLCSGLKAGLEVCSQQRPIMGLGGLFFISAASSLRASPAGEGDWRQKAGSRCPGPQRGCRIRAKYQQFTVGLRPFPPLDPAASRLRAHTLFDSD